MLFTVTYPAPALFKELSTEVVSIELIPLLKVCELTTLLATFTVTVKVEVPFALGVTVTTTVTCEGSIPNLRATTC